MNIAQVLDLDPQRPSELDSTSALDPGSTGARSLPLLLGQLKSVRETASGRWIACCPAHSDKTPSLAIREAEDGRILLHCFAGCTPLEVLGAVGLTMADLFPGETRRGSILHKKPLPDWKRKRLEAQRDHEELVIEIAVADLCNGKDLSPDDKKRCAQAHKRIAAIDELLRGRS